MLTVTVQALVQASLFSLAMAVALWRSAPRRWLLSLAAIAIVTVDDLITGHTQFFSLFSGTHWNWRGKISSIAMSLLVVAVLLRRGWSRQELGLTLRQQPGSLRPTCTVVLAFALVQTSIVLLVAEPTPWSWDTIAFQMLMPTLAEELLMRGILFGILDRAFTVRRTVVGAACGWAVPLTAFAFAFGHGITIDRDAIGTTGIWHGIWNGWTAHLEIGGFARTLVTGFLYGWLRARSGSLVMPMLLHTLVNSLGTIGRMLM